MSNDFSNDPRGDIFLDGILALAIGLGTGNAAEALESVERANQNRTILKRELPKDMNPSKEAFEKIGFKFQEVGDNVLYAASLPKGWKIKSDGGYWSYIYDQHNCRRGSIFYKGAFWDRNGHMSLERRFRIETEYAPGQEGIDEDEREQVLFVEDADGYKVKVFGQARRYGEKYRTTAEFEKLREDANQYMNEKYPYWDDPTEYWDWLNVEMQLRKEPLEAFCEMINISNKEMENILNTHGWKKINLKYPTKKKVRRAIQCLEAGEVTIYYNAMTKNKLAIFGKFGETGVLSVLG